MPPCVFLWRKERDLPSFGESESKIHDWFLTTGEFHTAKSRIVLNNYGAVMTKLFYSILFHMDFNIKVHMKQN